MQKAIGRNFITVRRAPLSKGLQITVAKGIKNTSGDVAGA
jgi:hypothetical protein